MTVASDCTRFYEEETAACEKIIGERSRTPYRRYFFFVVQLVHETFNEQSRRTIRRAVASTKSQVARVSKSLQQEASGRSLRRRCQVSRFQTAGLVHLQRSRRRSTIVFHRRRASDSTTGFAHLRRRSSPGFVPVGSPTSFSEQRLAGSCFVMTSAARK